MRPVVFRTLAVSVVFAAATASTQPTAAKTRAFNSVDLKYAIELPDACRHVEGPGTLEAICSVDLDAKKSETIAAAGAFVLEIDSEAVPADAKPYAEADFRQELPEAVCGEGDVNRIKLTDVTQSKDGARTTFRAKVICPEIRFLGLPERTAEVRYIIGTALRHRLMARVPSDDVPATKPATDAFFSSLKLSN